MQHLFQLDKRLCTDIICLQMRYKEDFSCIIVGKDTVIYNTQGKSIAGVPWVKTVILFMTKQPLLC